MISETVVSCSETQSLLRTALVIRYSMNRAEVVIDGEIRTALRTTGCGVDPRVGDRVVLFFPKGEIPLILSIIEGGSSSHSSPRTMSFPEGLVLEVSGHPFSLRSREGAEVDSPEICLRGQRMTGEFAECEIVSGRMTLTGGVLSFFGGKDRTGGQDHRACLRMAPRPGSWVDPGDRYARPTPLWRDNDRILVDRLDSGQDGPRGHR